MGKLKNWSIFIWERFSPITHLPMLVLFFISNYLFFVRFSQKEISQLQLALLFITTVLFYFRLRLFDEIKDYETDKIIKPHRPLPRGLITINETYATIAALVILELVFFYIVNTRHFWFYFIPLIYSFLMFKEFFIGEKFRPYLTTYAVTHTFVTLLFTMILFLGMFEWPVSKLPNLKLLLQMALNNWILFNIFEFGRKSYQAHNEKSDELTYSNLFGKSGAFALLFSQVTTSTVLTKNFFTFDRTLILLLLANLSTFTVGLLYLKSEKPLIGKIYQSLSSLYLILFFVIFMTDYI